jgi:hypothetical protein
MRPPLQTKPKASASAAPTLTSVRRGLLQRKNAYGDDACCKEDESGTSAPVTGQPLDLQARAFIESRFGHHLNNISVHAVPVPKASRELPVADFRPMVSNLIGAADQRFAEEAKERVPSADTFHYQPGQPKGGIAEEENEIGPTDWKIKPQPVAVLNGPFHAPIDEPTLVGMEIEVSVKSSTGDNADMACVQDCEKVGASFDHTGSLTTMSTITSRQSPFMSAVKLPNDRHSLGRSQIIDHVEKHPGDGSYSAYQLDVYQQPSYGIFDPIVIPNSGYKITRTITQGSECQRNFRVDKTPEACTVDGFSTTAGPSPAYFDEVLVRP